MMFDAYVPTLTSSFLEVRIRSSVSGPISIRIDGAEVTLDRPNVSYRGLHFYRHTFENLPSDTHTRVEARHLSSGAPAVVETATLPEPLGPSLLCIGVMADLHLPSKTGNIDQYRPGAKRLSGLGGELATRYIRRLENMGVDVIVLPGDLVDPCTRDTLVLLKEILRSVSVPCFPIIGNHEPWSIGGTARFHRELDLPGHGYYAHRMGKVRLLMLSTPDPGAIGNGSKQLRWLARQLEESAPSEDVVLFSHFSLLLHPCVEGSRNDGYQLLDNHKALLELISGHANVRLFVAGHKNVPSMVVRDGVIHTLSPQLIQAPCGYDLIHLYEGGAGRTTFEIDEQHYCEVARAAYAHDWITRYGDEHGRNFCIPYPN